MDEIQALKFIFRGEFNEETKTVTFNTRKYNYLEFLENKQGKDTFFSFILEKEEGASEVKAETKPQIDAYVAEVERITEEQFNEWKKNREVKLQNVKPTGKMIWLEQKKRGENHPELY